MNLDQLSDAQCEALSGGCEIDGCGLAFVNAIRSGWVFEERIFEIECSAGHVSSYRLVGDLGEPYWEFSRRVVVIVIDDDLGVFR